MFYESSVWGLVTIRLCSLQSHVFLQMCDNFNVEAPVKFTPFKSRSKCLCGISETCLIINRVPCFKKVTGARLDCWSLRTEATPWNA